MFFFNGNIMGGRKIKRYFGLVFIIISTLVFVFPEFFAYVFAGIVGLLGLSLLISSFTTPKTPPNPFEQFSKQFGKNYNKTEDGTYQELD